MKKIEKTLLLIVALVCSSFFITPLLPLAQSAQIVQVTNKMQVISKHAPLYAKATVKAKILQKLNQGTLVTLTGINGNFYQVKTTQGLIGYIKKSELDVYSPSGSSNSGSSNAGSTKPGSPNSGSSNSGSSNSGSSNSGSSNSGTIAANSITMQKEMLEYINTERKKAGLNALILDTSLSDGAYTKSKDMVDNKYFDHISPVYGDPFDMMDRLGIKYMIAGENLAINSSVKAAHTSLMKSSGHRANILRSSFKKVGFGFVQKGSSLYVTQWFTN